MKHVKTTIRIHDPFVSLSLEKAIIFQSLLKHHMPKGLLKLIDLKTLRRNDRVNTNSKVKTHRGDSSYKVDFKTGGTLIIHLEHQSTPDILMPFRFLQYAAGHLLAYFQIHKKTPMIFPFLLYHGEQSPYPYQTSLQDYYSFYPEWAKRALTLRFYLIDLTQLSDKEILKHGHCALLELLLKHGRDGKFELPPAAYRSVFQKCIAAVGEGYLSTILTYVASLEAAVGEKIYKFLEEVLTDKQNILMTYGEKLELKGEARGRQEGRQEGMQARSLEIARNMYRAGEPLDRVARWTGLSEASIRSL